MDIDLILTDPELARVAGKLRSLVRPAIRLMAGLESGNEPTTSRLGGRPALPPDVEWPVALLDVPPPSEAFRRAKPDLPTLPPDGTIALPFIAQLWLPDLAPYDEAGLLPQTGLLSFFYNPVAYYSDGGARNVVQDHLSGLAYGPYDDASPANWRVLYHDVPTEAFVLATPPADRPAPIEYPDRALRFAIEPTLPAVETAMIGEPDGKSGVVTLTAEEWDSYAELRHEARGDSPRHRALGYHESPQPYCLEQGYRRVRAAFFPELPPVEEGVSAVLDEVRAIVPLLQVDHFGGSPWFGRDGLLIFGIRATDLAARYFGKVWAVGV